VCLHARAGVCVWFKLKLSYKLKNCWLILIKYGIPKKLVNLIKSFHEDMQAGISVDGSLSIFTNSIVYKAVVLGVLLYAGLSSRESYIHWNFFIIVA